MYPETRTYLLSRYKLARTPSDRALAALVLSDYHHVKHQETSKYREAVTASLWHLRAGEHVSLSDVLWWRKHAMPRRVEGYLRMVYNDRCFVATQSRKMQDIGRVIDLGAHILDTAAADKRIHDYTCLIHVWVKEPRTECQQQIRQQLVDDWRP